VNLALNAKDAMPDGGVLAFETANVEREASADGGGGAAPAGRYVQLRVADTGQGMDAETLEHVFEPFFTTKEVGKGTGLGLAIVYGIVQAHRGFVRCHSLPGGGTTFELLFPAAPEPLGAEADPAPSEARPRGGTETVLLVDDEESILESGTEILRGRGYAALTARSGEEALAVVAARGSVDLVVLDLNMPGMGGMQCLRELKARAPALRVIVASGYPPGELRAELAEAGVGTFVRKPYRLDQFLGAVRKALDGTG
jgi:CheY-like chemotaxis protein